MPAFKPFYSIVQNDKALSYGLLYLKSDMKAQLDKMFDEFETCRLLFMPTPRDLLAATEAFERGDLPTGRNLMQRYRENGAQVALETMNARENASQFLAAVHTWEKWDGLLTDAPSRAHLADLKSRWLDHARYAHYPSGALLSAYKLVQGMQLHYHTAQIEFNDNQMDLPQAERQAYGQYLVEWKQQLQSEHASLLAAMQVRLRNLYEGNQLADDVFPRLSQALSRYAINLNAELPSALVSDGQILEATVVAQMQAALTAAGKAVPDTRSHLALTAIGQGNAAFLVPRHIAKLIPASTRSPAFLFAGHNQRHAFFKDRGDLLLHQSVLTATVLVRDLAKADPRSAEWLSLVKLQKDGLTAYGKAQQGAQKTRFYQAKTRRFYQDCQRELLASQPLLLEKQLAYLRQWLPLESENDQRTITAYTVEQTRALRTMLDTVQGVAKQLDAQLDPHKSHDVLPWVHQVTGLELQFKSAFNQDDRLRQRQSAADETDAYLQVVLKKPDARIETYQHVVGYYKSLSSWQDKKAWRTSEIGKGGLPARREVLSGLQAEMIERLESSLQMMDDKPLEVAAIARIQNLHYLLDDVAFLLNNSTWQTALTAITQKFEDKLSDITAVIPVAIKDNYDCFEALIKTLNTNHRLNRHKRPRVTANDHAQLQANLTDLFAKTAQQIKETKERLVETTELNTNSQTVLAAVADIDSNALIDDIAQLKAFYQNRQNPPAGVGEPGAKFTEEEVAEFSEDFRAIEAGVNDSEQTFTRLNP